MRWKILFDKRKLLQEFKVGGIVLKLILPMEQRFRIYGKWSPMWKGPYCVETIFSRNTYSLVGVESGLRIQATNGKYLKAYHKTIDRGLIGLRFNTLINPYYT